MWKTYPRPAPNLSASPTQISTSFLKTTTPTNIQLSYSGDGTITLSGYHPKSITITYNRTTKQLQFLSTGETLYTGGATADEMKIHLSATDEYSSDVVTVNWLFQQLEPEQMTTFDEEPVQITYVD